MENECIYNLWSEFINDNKYKKYFEDYSILWINKLNEVKKYIDENNKRPSSEDKNNEIKSLGSWILHQITNYKNKKYIMKNENIYYLWSEFINNDKYKNYFEDNDQVWINTLDKVKRYMDNNNKRPSSTDKNKDIKVLGIWISHQLKNYINKKEIMKNENIYYLWTEFINDDKYKIYFEDNNITWINNLEKVKKYIDENNKKLSRTDTNHEIKYLAIWICTQLQNYKNNKNIMLNEEIYNLWTQFINNDKYKIYFEDNNITWINTLEKVLKYIDENNKRPSAADKNNEIKSLGHWINQQQNHYKNKKYIMENENIYNVWTTFINDNKYKEYFEDNSISWCNILNEVKKYIDENNKRPTSININLEIKEL